MPRPEAVERIGARNVVAFEGSAYRIVAGRYAPTSGEGSRSVGGRWNPPESFPTLYLGVNEEVVAAEMERQARMQGRRIEDFVDLRLYRLEVSLHAVLDLRNADALKAVGLTLADLASMNRNACQEVGDAAHFLGREAILAPSATGRGDILAVFTDNRHPDSVIEPIEHHGWPAV